MQFLYYVFLAYLSVSLLVALHFGWHMLRLDRFDWRYGHIVSKSLVGVLLWPVLFLVPQNIVNPTRLFKYDGIADRIREETRLWDYPPPCGRFVRYRQGPARSGSETYGEIIFRSADLEEELAPLISKNADQKYSEVGAIVKWLRQRDESIAELTLMPSAWSRFKFFADDLFRKGFGEMHCTKCNARIPRNQLQGMGRYKIHPGWNFNTLKCPKGHMLLCVETVHNYFRDS